MYDLQNLVRAVWDIFKNGIYVFVFYPAVLFFLLLLGLIAFVGSAASGDWQGFASRKKSLGSNVLYYTQTWHRLKNTSVPGFGTIVYSLVSFAMLFLIVSLFQGVVLEITGAMVNLQTMLIMSGAFYFVFSGLILPLGAVIMGESPTVDSFDSSRLPYPLEQHAKAMALQADGGYGNNMMNLPQSASVMGLPPLPSQQSGLNGGVMGLPVVSGGTDGLYKNIQPAAKTEKPRDPDRAYGSHFGAAIAKNNHLVHLNRDELPKDKRSASDQQKQSEAMKKMPALPAATGGMSLPPASPIPQFAPPATSMPPSVPNINPAAQFPVPNMMPNSVPSGVPIPGQGGWNQPVPDPYGQQQSPYPAPQMPPVPQQPVPGYPSVPPAPVPQQPQPSAMPYGYTPPDPQPQQYPQQQPYQQAAPTQQPYNPYAQPQQNANGYMQPQYKDRTETKQKIVKNMSEEILKYRNKQKPIALTVSYKVNNQEYNLCENVQPHLMSAYFAQFQSTAATAPSTEYVLKIMSPNNNNQWAQKQTSGRIYGSELVDLLRAILATSGYAA